MRLRHKVVQHIVLCCLGVMLKEDVTTPYGKSGSKMEGWISEECYPASLNTLAVISRPLATCTSHRWQNLQKVPEQAGYIGVQSVAFDLQPVTEIIRSVVNKGHLGHSSLVLVGNVLSQSARGVHHGMSHIKQHECVEIWKWSGSHGKLSIGWNGHLNSGSCVLKVKSNSIQTIACSIRQINSVKYCEG